MAITINGNGSVTGLSVGGLPDATITQAELAPNVAGNGPVFSAYAPAAQSIPNNLYTKLTMTTEDIDSSSSYDATNSRFQPTVAGYYFLTCTCTFTINSTGGRLVAIFKNGVEARRSGGVGGITGDWAGASVSSIIYMNGTTDYVEFFGYQDSGAALSTIGGAVTNHASGFLARAA